jgi:hypothetical protein
MSADVQNRVRRLLRSGRPSADAVLSALDAVNPTGLGLSRDQEDARYAAKAQLQSLLIRLFPDTLTLHPGDPLPLHVAANPHGGERSHQFRRDRRLPAPRHAARGDQHGPPRHGQPLGEIEVAKGFGVRDHVALAAADGGDRLRAGARRGLCGHLQL